MAIAVEMPKPGNTVDECLLGKWLKPAGARVSVGDIIAEIETDKATFDVQAPADGTLLVTFFDEGQLVPVFANICVIGEPGEDTAAFAPQAALPEQAAEESALPAPEIAVPPPRIEAASAPKMSPRARRFARENGIPADSIPGSGPDGRILESDVQGFYHSSPLAAVQTEPRPSGSVSGLHGMVPADDLDAPAAPLDRLREKIARRMRESLSETAQYTLMSSANAAGLLALRARIKNSRREPDININELVLFCVVQALGMMPQLNAELRDGKLRRHKNVHLGFACDTERGLLVPVVRNAQALDVSALAVAVKTLAQRAVKGDISPDDLTGATFTVSNLGNLGIESFTPLLNPPQVAILGVNSIQVRPIRTAAGIEFQDRIGLSLTCDHQVIDGAPGARFLGVLRECIEQVEALTGLAV